MQRFFSGEVCKPVSIGDSSLSGMYECNYCKEACAQLGRFQIYVGSDDNDGRGSFCVPECAKAYVKWRKSWTQQEADFIDSRAGRPVGEAPARGLLWRYNHVTGMKREQWLPLCRQNLTPAESEIARRELFVQRLDVNETKSKN